MLNRQTDILTDLHIFFCQVYDYIVVSVEQKIICASNLVKNCSNILNDSLSSTHFQIGIQAPEWHFFCQQFFVVLLQTVCKQSRKGPRKIASQRNAI